MHLIIKTSYCTKFEWWVHWDRKGQVLLRVMSNVSRKEAHYIHCPLSWAKKVHKPVLSKRWFLGSIFSDKNSFLEHYDNSCSRVAAEHTSLSVAHDVIGQVSSLLRKFVPRWLSGKCLCTIANKKFHPNPCLRSAKKRAQVFLDPSSPHPNTSKASINVVLIKS